MEDFRNWATTGLTGVVGLHLGDCAVSHNYFYVDRLAV